MSAVKLDASAGQILRLEHVLQGSAFAFALGADIIHLEAAHGGGASSSGFPIPYMLTFFSLSS